VRLSENRSQLVLTVVGALVGLAFAIALFVQYGPGTDVAAQVRSYEVLSDTSVRVDVEVARDPGTKAWCVLRARDREGAEVGRRQVDVPVSGDRSTVLSVAVTTTGRANTGELVGCEAGSAPQRG
jgi:hypothetical protein